MFRDDLPDDDLEDPEDDRPEDDRLEDDEPLDTELLREYLSALPDREAMIEWDVADWLRFFDQHDCRSNAFLGRMRGREETDDAFAAALQEAEEDSERDRRKVQKLSSWLERELEAPEHREPDDALEEPWSGAGRPDARPGEAEPWKASLPELPPQFRGEDACDPRGDWDAITAECPAFGDAMRLLRELGSMLANVRRQRPALTFAASSISSMIIGVSMGHGYWSRREAFPLAKTARYLLAARRFEQVARIFEGVEAPEFRALAPGARAIARGFLAAAESTDSRPE